MEKKRGKERRLGTEDNGTVTLLIGVTRQSSLYAPEREYGNRQNYETL